MPTSKTQNLKKKKKSRILYIKIQILRSWSHKWQYLVRYESTGTPSTVNELLTTPETLSNSSIWRRILWDTPSINAFDCTIHRIAQISTHLIEITTKLSIFRRITKKSPWRGHRWGPKGNPTFQRGDSEYWTAKITSKKFELLTTDYKMNWIIVVDPERERVCTYIYPVERGVEGVFGDGILQAAPERRGGVLDGERCHPVPRRHCWLICEGLDLRWVIVIRILIYSESKLERVVW